MSILSGETVSQFVGHRPAEHVGAGVENGLNRSRGRGLYGMGSQPVRVTETGARASDVKHVLGRKREPVERPVPSVFERHVIAAAECAERIVWYIAWCHTRILRPIQPCRFMRKRQPPAFEAEQGLHQLGDRRCRIGTVEHDQVGGITLTDAVIIEAQQRR